MNQRSTPPDEYPSTVAEAVDWLVTVLPDDSKQTIAGMEEDDLIELHFGLGMYIRNQLGLWGGNDALMEDCGGGQPDDASGVIIEALWRKLRHGPGQQGTSA